MIISKGDSRSQSWEENRGVEGGRGGKWGVGVIRGRTKIFRHVLHVRLLHGKTMPLISEGHSQEAYITELK